MDIDRQKIYTVISEMLDNPDENGVFQTTKACDDLENYIVFVRWSTLGWAVAHACCLADRAADIRKVDVPEIMEQYKKDLLE